MGNTIEQNIKVKEIFDVSEALKGIKQIQDALSKLALDPSTKASFNNLFQNMENQAKKASAAAASGFKNKGDVTAYTRAMDQIVDSYDRIISKIELLKADGSLTLDIDTSEFKQVNARINELKRNLDDLGDKISKSLSTIDKIEGRRGANGTIKSVGSWQTAIEEFKNGNMQKATAALRVLKGLMTKASNNGVDFEKDKTWKAFKKDYEELKKAIDDYNTANQQYGQDSSELAIKDKRRQEILEDTNKLLEQTDELTKKSGQSAREYAIETEKAASDTQKLNSELEHFKSKTAYFFGISNAINLFKRGLRSAYETVKDLDAVMTETAVVTPFSVGDMWSQLPEYTQRANELGVTIHDTYEAATLFYQQGLKTNEVMQISNETLKMARIAGLDAATASDRMTNALRGFNMELDKVSAQRVNDVYSKLAAITASNTDEISTAMTKVASLAHNANMEFETTAAFLAQIIESTRESAETAGTALKTVVARFSEVKKLYSKGELLGQDEEGEEIDVNKVSTALRSAGINLNEYLTGAKGLDDIFIELAEKWDSLDQVQQRYIATMAAGSRQQSRFIALMSDYKRTMQLVTAANDANGASQQQYEKTLESLQTKLARLKNAWNEFILGLANSDAIKGAVDLLTSLITAINNLIKLISGKNAGVKMITSFFTAFTAFKIGQKAIGKSDGITKFFTALTGNAKVTASTSAGEIVSSFYTNLANKIANYKEGDLGAWKDKKLEGMFSPLQKLANYWSPEDQFKKNVMNRINPQTNVDQREAIEAALNNEKLSLKELDQVLIDNGQSFKTTGKEGRQFGLTMGKTVGSVDKFNTTMRVAANVTLVAGSALMIWGSNLEKEGNEAGKVIKILGMAFTAFGTIMSVYLPLQAQIGAKGVTTAIASIPIVGWVAAAIAALTALIAVFVALGKENSAENQLKKAAEASKAAAEAADEAREAYEKLSDAWNSLEEKYDAIENATEGTLEWRDAVREVNNAVLELLNTYDSLEVERDENGILKITKQSQDALTDKIRNDVLYTEANERLTKIDELERLQDVRYKEIANEWNGSAPYRSTVDILQEQGRLGSATPEEIESILKSEFEKKGTNANPESYIDEIMEYGKIYAQNQASINAQKTALTSTILDKAEIDKNLEKYADIFLNDKYLEDLMWAKRQDVAADDSNLNENYAKARGYDDYAQYKDANPDEKHTAQEMQTYVAAAWMTDEAADKAKAFANKVNNLTDAEKALFSQEGGGGLTRNQLDAYLSSDYDRDALFERLGGIDQFGSREVFDNLFENILIGAIDNFDTAQYGEKFKNIFESSFNYITGNLDANTFKTFMDNMYSIYSTTGEEGFKKVRASLTAVIGELEPDKVDDFVRGINDINWASTDSLEQLDTLAEEFGISEEAMESFKSQVIELGNAASKIDLEKFGSVVGIIKKIQSGEQGRSFSEEDYQKLIDQGVNEKDFKFNLETGSYDYIGQNLQNIVTSVEDYFNTATKSLERQVASNEAVDKLRENGALPTDETDFEQVKNFLTGYNYIAGENSLVSTDFIQTANEDEIFAKYNEIMNTFAQRTAIQNTLDQAYAYNLQTKSSADLAALTNAGDTDAEDTLKQQVINSGLSEAVIQALLEGIESGDTEKITSAGGVVDTIKTAGEFGISTEDLEAYVTALRTVDELQNANEATLYGLALANANYQEGFKSVIESYEEWIELKQEDGSIRAEDGNEEQLKAFDKLKKDLKQMFNLTEDVSNEFFKSAENVELLEAAVNGDTEAVSKLRAELAKTKINLLIDDENVKNQAYALFDDIIDEAGTLEFGASLDMAPAMQALQQLLEASGVTVSDMAKIFESFGWTPEVTEKAVPFTSFQQMRTQGYQEVVDPVTHETVPIPTEGEDHYVQDGMILVPVFGGATFTPPEIPSFSPSTSSSGGGGGGSEKKPSYWENPYDELYNLQEKINEALRKREDLERRYQKLLKQEQATLRDIRKAYYDQIAHLSSEADLQKQMAEGRLRQIKQIGEQMYTDSEGDRTSFSDLGVTKYASYNEKTGLIQIDWSGLEAIANDSDRTEEGKAAEAYISKLEELVSSYEEVRDKLWEIEDKIEEIRQAAIDSYLSFEDRVMDAVVDSYQRQIDSYQDMSETLEKANTEIIDSIHEQIDLSRQIRDNTKKEQDIADMENRLAYLQRDTSGGNDLEILKLQKDIDKAREDYTDTLIDQAISDMQKDAERAAEQRSKQIDIMNAQLKLWQDNGLLWKETHNLINGAIGKDGTLDYESKLIKYLENTEAYKALSAIGQEKWREEVAEAFHKAWVGKDEAEDKYDVDANDDKIVNHSGTSDALEHVTGTETSTTREDPFGPYGRHKFDEATEAGVAMNICGPNQGWGNGEERFSKLEEKGLDAGAVQSIVNDIVNSGWDDSYYRKKYDIDDLSDYSYYAFKSGGLADFTGPAWLDGTKTKPEIILSAQDSANFIALRDILASLLNVQGGLNNNQKGGDNYFDIDISANIDSDYDVDKLAERIKKGIYEDGQYRNVNTINYLR